MGTKKIVTAVSELIVGLPKFDDLTYEFDDDYKLVSLAMNVPVPNMVFINSIDFGPYIYQKEGADDAIFYYPLIESATVVAKRECRRLEPLEVKSGHALRVRFQNTGFVPRDMFGGMMFTFVVSIEVETVNLDF